MLSLSQPQNASQNAWGARGFDPGDCAHGGFGVRPDVLGSRIKATVATPDRALQESSSKYCYRFCIKCIQTFNL